MGKGDKKTRRGKIVKGSYGNLRPRKKVNKITTDLKSKPKKAQTKKEEIVELPVEAIEEKVTVKKTAAKTKKTKEADVTEKSAAKKKTTKKESGEDTPEETKE